MDREIIKDLLEQLQKGEVGVDDVMKALKDLPFEDIGMACIDHHRGLRRGLSEVVFGEGKTADQILSIMTHMARRNENIMVTRLSRDKADIILKNFPDGDYQEAARVLTLTHHPVEHVGRGTVLVISAGTSDIPVAEEAAITARFMGNQVDTVYDVGVSGLHRVLAHREQLDRATVIIVVAGMEGALPSVVGGLVDKPVIAVPTSIGYGASFGGVTALLGMLNSCASGVTVVNIDNGFGAGYAASLINRKK